MTARDPTGRPEPEEQDAFLRGVLRALQWAQENSRVVTIGAVVALVAVAGTLYYRNYREDVRQQAAQRLQTLQSQLQSQSPSDTLRRSIGDFVSRYGDTRSGDEARLLLGRLHLNQNRFEAALSAVEPLPSEYPVDSPAGYAARKLLAAAHEGAGNTERALSLYAELAEGAQFPFQRHEASANRASLLAEEGRLGEAERIYSRLVQEADTTQAGVTTANLQSYRVRLGELQGRLGSGDTTGRAAAPGAPSDTSGT